MQAKFRVPCRAGRAGDGRRGGEARGGARCTRATAHRRPASAGRHFGSSSARDWSSPARRFRADAAVCAPRACAVGVCACACAHGGHGPSGAAGESHGRGRGPRAGGIRGKRARTARRGRRVMRLSAATPPWGPWALRRAGARRAPWPACLLACSPAWHGGPGAEVGRQGARLSAPGRAGRPGPPSSRAEMRLEHAWPVPSTGRAGARGSLAPAAGGGALRALLGQPWSDADSAFSAAAPPPPPPGPRAACAPDAAGFEAMETAARAQGDVGELLARPGPRRWDNVMHTSWHMSLRCAVDARTCAPSANAAEGRTREVAPPHACPLLLCEAARARCMGE